MEAAAQPRPTSATLPSAAPNARYDMSGGHSGYQKHCTGIAEGALLGKVAGSLIDLILLMLGLCRCRRVGVVSSMLTKRTRLCICLLPCRSGDLRYQSIAYVTVNQALLYHYLLVQE